MSNSVEIQLIAYDEATSVIANVGATMQGTLNEIESGTQGVIASNDEVNASFSDSAMSMANVATAGMSLYMSYFMIERAQVQVDRANLMVQRSTETLEKAQTAYNDAVAKYGDNSTQAQTALDKLNIAQTAYQVATERAQMSQGNLNNSMVFAAISVIPSLITMASSAGMAITNFGVVTEALGGVLDVLAENPIILVVAGIAALAAGLVWAYENCAPFRNAINDIGNALVWLGGIIVGGVTAAINTVVGAFSAAVNAINGFIDFVNGVSPPTQAATSATKDLSSAINEENVAFANAHNTAGAMHSKIMAQQAEEAAAAKKTADDTATALKDIGSQYDLLKAQTSNVLPLIHKWFEEAFNKDDLNQAASLVQQFAAAYHISISDAERTIEDFKAAQATIPQTIEEQLIGKAQADMQTFQNCMSGKAFTLSTDVTGNMKNMASDITDLINHGLVGEAQDAMKAYTACSTNKVSDMVLQINTDMQNLTTQHNKDIADMKSYAETLTGQEKDAVLAQIDAMTTAYNAKMNQLKDWQSQIVGQITTQTTQAFSDMTDSVIGHVRRLSDQVVALSIWPDMLEEMNRQTDENLGTVEKRFGKMSESVQGSMPTATSTAITSTISGLGGGASGRTPVNISIQNLLYIEGNPDRTMIELAKKEMLEALKTIIVEPSSSGAAATSKRIRKGALF